VRPTLDRVIGAQWFTSDNPVTESYWEAWYVPAGWTFPLQDQDNYDSVSFNVAPTPKDDPRLPLQPVRGTITYDGIAYYIDGISFWELADLDFEWGNPTPPNMSPAGSLACATAKTGDTALAALKQQGYSPTSEVRHYVKVEYPAAPRWRLGVIPDGKAVGRTYPWSWTD
jgi:hypothetical protein